MTATKIRPVQATAPERIYLQGGPQLPPETEFGALSEVTWCRDDVDGTGIPYVRADLAGAAPVAAAGPAIDRAATLAAIDDISEPSWTGYECPNTWADGLSAARAVVQTAPAAPALEAPVAPAVHAALQRLEDACDARAALTTSEAYNMLILLPGMQDALQELDEARGQACAALAAAPQAPRLGEDALHLLHRLLSNQHTLTGPEFRAELEKIVAEESARHAAAPQAPAAPVVLGWVHRSPKGHIGNHFYTYEPHCDTAVRDGGGEKIAVIAFHEAAPAAPAVDAELLELAQAIVKYNRQHGGVLAVHINNLADLVDERAAQAKEGGA